MQNAIRQLALEFSRRQIDVHVLALRDKFTAQDLAAWGPLVPETYETTLPRQLGYSMGLAKALKYAEQSILHQHGLWQLFSGDIRAWGKRTGRPVIISPHGMLDPWAIRNSAWKKRIAMALYERRNLKSAACIHALNTSEAESIRALGFTNPIAVIPNGVELPPTTNFTPGHPF